MLRPRRWRALKDGGAGRGDRGGGGGGEAGCSAVELPRRRKGCDLERRMDWDRRRNLDGGMARSVALDTDTQGKTLRHAHRNTQESTQEHRKTLTVFPHSLPSLSSSLTHALTFSENGPEGKGGCLATAKGGGGVRAGTNARE